MTTKTYCDPITQSTCQCRPGRILPYKEVAVTDLLAELTQAVTKSQNKWSAGYLGDHDRHQWKRRQALDIYL